ncbi:ATP-binding protein [Niallia sp. Krafla_26]|uniref:ATP-binding protein n=1 Tax=Niallia sp. Krafla_26 TaxID=3064703 RepID=UPI003D1737D5
MKRDVSIVPFNEREVLVIAADNSGGIGLKNDDVVRTPYDVVSYFAFRVAVMECLAAGGKPLSVVVQNFCHEDAWDALMTGIYKGLAEIGVGDLPITGSTESNFSLLQSALGMMVIGKRSVSYQEPCVSMDEMKLAVIGSPLVGDEVLDYPEEVVPLSLYYELCQLEGVVLLPVGSKGILRELRNMLDENSLVEDSLRCVVDVVKTGGPSTCVIMAFNAELEPYLIEKCRNLYHSIEVTF